MFTFVFVIYLVILPLTALTLRLLHVPEHLELVAGSLLTFAYGFLGTVLLAGLV